jgi:methionyl-tRNA formyltransferase
MSKVKDICNYNSITSILLFTDDFGLEFFLKYLPKNVICGVVGASIRPEQHRKMLHLCQLHSLNFFIQPVSTSKKYKLFENEIKECSPDLIWVNSYSMKLMNNILNVPRFGAINIHASLLPKYRGCSPIQWAMINDERETGVTLHKMNENFDAGDIIDQEKVPISFLATWKDVKLLVAKQISEIICRNIDPILSGNITSTPQSERNASYYKRRSADDGRFSWSDPIIDIYNLVRALVPPLPGAYYVDNFDRKIIISNFHRIEELAIIKTKINKTLFKFKNVEVKAKKFTENGELLTSLEDGVTKNISACIVFTEDRKVQVAIDHVKLENIPGLFLETLEKCLKNEFRSEYILTNNSLLT